MGCCGNRFKDKLSIAEGIQKNTLEFHSHTQKNRPVKDWMNRSKDTRDSGVCRNLIYDVNKNKIFCGAHPDVHLGVDLRIDHHYCDILHVCKTAFFFDLWEKDMKDDFIKFLRTKKKQGLDWHSYSMGMADDSLLAEFEGLKW